VYKDEVYVGLPLTKYPRASTEKKWRNFFQNTKLFFGMK
jgi:hypothetical protein